MAAKKDTGPEFKRRLSPKDIMGVKILTLVDAENPTDLFQVMGIGNSIKTKETQYGTATAVIGQFEVVRLTDGVIMLGNVLYLPEPCGSAIANAVKAQMAMGDANVQFIATIGIKADAKSNTGYVYIWKPYLKPEQRAALDALRGEAQKLLPSWPK